MSPGLGVLGPSLPPNCCGPLNESSSSLCLSFPIHAMGMESAPNPFKTSQLEAPPHGLTLGVFPLTPCSYLCRPALLPPTPGSALTQLCCGGTQRGGGLGPVLGSCRMPGKSRPGRDQWVQSWLGQDDAERG